MTTWLKDWLPLISFIATVLVIWIAPRLRTKRAGDLDKTISDQKKDFDKSISEINQQLKGIHDEGWTRRERQDLEARLVKLEVEFMTMRTELVSAKATSTDLLRLLEKALIPVAHSPHTPELDELLDKRARGDDLTDEEWRRLAWLLKEQAENEQEISKKVVFRTLRAVIIATYQQKEREKNLPHVA